MTGSKPLPPGSFKGPMQGVEIIGEITEALHSHLMNSWEFERNPPRIEEDLSFVPKDREEVIYVYMYRAQANRALMNTKRHRATNLSPPGDDRIYYERAPLYLELFYLVSVHSKFRSDAERLLGYVMLALHEATHLVYRPRKHVLPGGEVVNSRGEPWSAEADLTDDEMVYEKVALALVEDLTVGDAINFFTIHEAPYRPYLTYCARCAMQGSLVSGEATTVSSAPATELRRQGAGVHRPSGRIPRDAAEKPTGRFRTPFGPQGHNPRRVGSDPSDTPDSDESS